MTKFREYHRNIKIRIAQIFLSDFVIGAIFPFMAIYFSNHFGAKLTGLILVLNVLIGFIVSLYGGYYADRAGRKKLMVIAGIIRLLALMVITFANSPLFISPELTFFMVLIINASFGLEGPAADAMIIDISKPEQRKGIYSLIYWSFNLAFAIGGIIGALTFKDFLFQLLMVLTITNVVNNVLVIFFIQETMEKRETTKQKRVWRNMYQSYKQVAGDKLFVAFIFSGILLQSLENQLENYIAVRLDNEMPTQSFFLLDVSGVEMLGFLRTENTIIVVLFTVLITKIISKFREDRTYLFSIFVFTVGYVGVSYFNNIWLLFMFMFLATIGELMRVPIQSDYLASIPSDDKRSSYMAVYGLVFNGSMLLSSFFVTLGAFLNKEMMSFLILGIGLLGYMISAKILPDLKARRNLVHQAIEKE